MKTERGVEERVRQRGGWGRESVGVWEGESSRLVRWRERKRRT